MMNEVHGSEDRKKGIHARNMAKASLEVLVRVWRVERRVLGLGK